MKPEDEPIVGLILVGLTLVASLWGFMALCDFIRWVSN